MEEIENNYEKTKDQFALLHRMKCSKDEQLIMENYFETKFMDYVTEAEFEKIKNGVSNI